jgi:hypothetical protein
MRILNAVDERRHSEVMAELAHGREGVFLSNVAVSPPVPQASRPAPRAAAVATEGYSPSVPSRCEPRDLPGVHRPIDDGANPILRQALGHGHEDHDQGDDLDQDERREQASLLRLLATLAQSPGVSGMEARELLRRAATPSAYGPNGPRALLHELRAALRSQRPASETGTSTSEAAQKAPFVA